MNLNQLATGVFSGYATKAIQLIASLVLVPFLLDREILGVEDYGRAFAILGVTGIFSFVVVGFHFSAERMIARSVGETGSSGSLSTIDLLGSATKVLLLTSVAYLAPLFFFESRILNWLGIPLEPRYHIALLAAGSISLLENGLYLFRVPLIARGDIAFVNLVGMLEITCRTLIVFLVFSSTDATIATLLIIQATFTLARQTAFILRLDSSERSRLLRAPLSHSIETLRYARLISVVEGSTLFVRNIPVIVASRCLGPTEAGFVAIVANTIQGYILQTFLAVFQPLAIPLAARLRFSEMNQSRRTQFLEIESLYVLAIALLFGQAIIWTPHLIPIWLGAGFEEITLPTQIMIAGCGLQTSSLIRRAMLIAHGELSRTIITVATSAIVSTILMVIGVVWFDSWFAAIVFSATHIAASNALGFDRVFSGLLGRIDASIQLPNALSVTIIFAAVWLVETQFAPRSNAEVFATSLAGCLVTIGLGSVSLVSPRKGFEIMSMLYRARRSDLFR